MRLTAMFSSTLPSVWHGLKHTDPSGILSRYSVLPIQDLRVFSCLFFYGGRTGKTCSESHYPAGYSDFDYHEPLLSALPHKSDLGNVFSGIFDEISGRFRFDAAEISGILSRTEGKYWSVENESAPFSDLSSFRTPGEFMQTLKSSLRGDIGRQIRRLEKTGSPELVEYNDLNEAVNVLPSFLELHKRRWPNAYKARGFHENILRSGLSENLVHFTALRVNEI